MNLLAPHVPRWPKGEPVVELRGVHKRFGDLHLLRGVDLTVHAGETFVIAGESGSGKSVLLKMMNGLVTPDEGEVLLFGQPLAALSEAERTLLRRRCTMVFQSYALIDSMTVAENISFPLAQGSDLPQREVGRLVDDLLTLLELPGTGGLLPASLSGGMRKRVALARAVISNPEVVLFDEPTTGLDPVMIEFVDALIAKTQRLYGITSVLVSHDMTSNRRLADRMGVLSEGVMAEVGSFDDVARSAHPAVRAFMSSAVTERMREGGAPRPEGAGEGAAEGAADDSAEGAGEGTSALAALSAEDLPADLTPPPAVSPALAHLPSAARCVGLHKRFGEREVLKGITLSIPQRKITVIIGGSGSGKSVLVKHIIGLLAPTRGEVEVLGRDLTRADPEAVRATQREVGVLFQGAALFDSMTVGENISFPLVEGRRVPRREARARAAEIAERLSVGHLLRRYPDEISNGERKRVGLARALVTRPRIMIYDEPTTGQDPIMMRRVDDMIVEAAELFDMTSIVISHDMSSTFRVADQVVMVYQGELLACGTPDEVRSSRDPRVRRFIYAGG